MARGLCLCTVLVSCGIRACARPGVEPPDRIRTFSQSSPEEQSFDLPRYAPADDRLRLWVTLAVLIGLIGAFKVIHWN